MMQSVVQQSPVGWNQTQIERNPEEYHRPVGKLSSLVPNTPTPKTYASPVMIQSQIAYSDHITQNIGTISPNYIPSNGNLIQGLLYVPDLDAGDGCIGKSNSIIPTSVVRQANLPPTAYNLIAIAPWIDSDCSKSFLRAARQDPLRALIFYLPTNDTSPPPPADAGEWLIDDAMDWKSQNHFPVFAVPGAIGSQMMYQLSLYSGDLSTVPYGQNISDLYNPNVGDYVRIWTELYTSPPSTLPAIWAFVLIIVGVIIFVIASTSCLMHLTWRQRRASLRRRVIDGEVNLEAMGIKRLSVPLEHIQSFPLYTYHYEPAEISPQMSPALPQEPEKAVVAAAGNVQARDMSDLASSGPAHSVAGEKPASRADAPSLIVTDLNYQPACLICFASFQNRETIIRELPCGHIFHPVCIDGLLSEVSSLCPVCKASMLPPGSCPPVTNSMVRRELTVRRLRERLSHDSDDEDDDVVDGAPAGRIRSWGTAFRKRLHSIGHRSHSRRSVASNAEYGNVAIELPRLSAKADERRPSNLSTGVAGRRLIRLSTLSSDADTVGGTSPSRCKCDRATHPEE